MTTLPSSPESKPETAESVEPVKSEVSKSPAPAKPKRHVVGGGQTDDVSFKAYTDPATRKSLTIHQLQRRLVELGHSEAGADRDGRVGDLTKSAVRAWQKANKHAETGTLTEEQFAEVFKGDTNVTVVA